jgi:hypothetical protein
VCNANEEQYCGEHATDGDVEVLKGRMNRLGNDHACVASKHQRSAAIAEQEPEAVNDTQDVNDTDDGGDLVRRD